MVIAIQSIPNFADVLEDLHFGLQPGPTTILELDVTTLRGADFSGMNLENAQLAEAAPGRDLSDALFSGARLIKPSLDSATLQGAIFSKANVYIGDFCSSDLTGAKCDGANLSHAQFTNANQTRVDFSNANLENADLSSAVLDEAVFAGAKLSGANFRGARVANTVFKRCNTLGQARGLDALVYNGAILINHHALITNMPGLPDALLAALGFSPNAILEARLRYGPLPPLCSCFLSYTRTDAAFADQLRRGLIGMGASCWQDVSDMKGGKLWRDQIRAQIGLCEKFLLICSRQSIRSAEVINELEMAVTTEQTPGVAILVPITIDGWITLPLAVDLGDKRVRVGAWSTNWDQAHPAVSCHRLQRVGRSWSFQ